MGNITSKDRSGSIDVYDGTRFAGSILAQRGRWIAFDERGSRIRDFSREREAASAVYQASRPGGAA